MNDVSGYGGSGDVFGAGIEQSRITRTFRGVTELVQIA